MAQDPLQTKSSDEQLVHMVLDGDITAFGSLVERYWNMVFGLALSRIDHPAEAEDVGQESFLKAYSQLRALRDPSRFAGWLSKITQQQCTNALRRTLRCRAALSTQAGSVRQLEAVPAYSPNPGLTEDQMQFVRQTVGQLPDKFRQLVIMRFMGGLSAVQIAEQLGKRPGTVRVWLHRAYTILRKDLAPLLEEVGS